MTNDLVVVTDWPTDLLTAAVKSIMQNIIRYVHSVWHIII